MKNLFFAFLIVGLSLVRFWYIALPALLLVAVPVFLLFRRWKRDLVLASLSAFASAVVVAFLLAVFVFIPTLVEWSELDWP